VNSSSVQEERSIPIVATLIRASRSEIESVRDEPALALSFDARQALSDGRAIDLGRRWEELGCLLDGGIATPESGPVVGDEPIACNDERELWRFVVPERAASIAADLAKVTRRTFMGLYRVEEDDTAHDLPEARTGAWGDGGEYLYERFVEMRAHYRVAAQRGEGMLVRIGARVEGGPRSKR
jgi:Domain of unknown function (DUF1877)